MGDRANVYVKNTEKAGVFLYTHWAGTKLPETVQAALKRELRWNDPQYLARIIFDEMTGGKMEETGFGISAVIGDNEARRPIIYVDPEAQTIGFAEQPAGEDPPKPPAKMMTFKEFVIKDLRGGGWPPR